MNAPQAMQDSARQHSALQGLIETILPDGTACGWVRDVNDPGQCHMEIRFAGRVVAAAVAHGFRADLLANGHGHGYHGFAARLTMPVPPGRQVLELCLSRTGQGAPMSVIVPPIVPQAVVAVEALLQPRPAWQAWELAAHPACLKAPENYRALGPARFVDAAFRFVLGRWPSPGEAAAQCWALEHRAIGAEALLVELLQSRERAELKTRLASPFDPGFPFVL